MALEAREAKRLVAGVYSRAAPTYDSFASSYFAHYAERLVARAAPAADASVLDAACGTGAITCAVAPRLDGGRVVACDIAEGMVVAARDQCVARQHRAATTAVMDAERLGFRAAPFDVVFCAFALHIVPEPRDALAEFARVVRPGGMLACSAWAEDDPRWDWEREFFASMGARGRLQSHDLSSDGALRAVLDDSWVDIDVAQEDYEAILRDEEEWWAWKWSYGIRHALEHLDDAGLARLQAASFERMAPQREPAGYPLRLRAWLLTARRAQ